MSWMDEEIDSVFKEAANQPTFEYRPEYWKDIEKQLPVNKKKKLFIWWWTAGVFIVGIIGYGIFTNNTESVNESKMAVSNNYTNNGILQSSKNVKNTTSNNSLKSNESVNSVLKGKNINYKNVESKETVQLPNNPKKQINPFVENQPAINVLSNVEDKSAESNLTDKEFILEIENPEVVNNENSEIGLKTIPFSYTVPSAELISSTKFEKKDHLSRFYFELNGGVGQQYTVNNPADVNAIYGASFGVKFPVKMFTLTVAAGYQGTTFSDLNIKERTMIYGLGSKTLENSYEFSSIHAFTLPIAVSYTYKRHSFSLGMTTSMNFITRLKHSESLDGQRTSYTSGVSDVSFFNRFSLQPSVGYSYFVNEKTQIGARFNLELLSPLNSDRFIGEHTKFPINGQVYLRRTLEF